MSEAARALLQEITRFIQSSVTGVTVAEIADQFNLEEETVRTVIATVWELYEDGGVILYQGHHV